MPKQIEIVQGSVEWLEYRRNKRNASEAGNVMGCGFQTPATFAKMKYLGDGGYVNDAMKDGVKYEPQIRDFINQKYGLNLIPAVFLEGEYSASLDGYDQETGTIAEFKMSESEYAFLALNNHPTAKYYAQMQHQMYVMGAKKVLYAVGKIGKDFNLELIDIEVKRDNDYIARLLTKWDEFVAKYSHLRKEMVYINDFVLNDLSVKYAELQAKIKALESQLNDIRGEITAKLDSSDDFVGTATIGNLTITKSEPSGDKYDYKAYCLANDIKPGDEFIKEIKPKWIFKVKGDLK